VGAQPGIDHANDKLMLHVPALRSDSHKEGDSGPTHLASRTTLGTIHFHGNFKYRQAQKSKNPHFLIGSLLHTSNATIKLSKVPVAVDC
jgi:hypothetical protein